MLYHYLMRLCSVGLFYAMASYCVVLCQLIMGLTSVLTLLYKALQCCALLFRVCVML